MSWKKPRFFSIGLFLSLTLASASVPAPVILQGSVRQVPVWSSMGPPNPARALVTTSTLTTAEQSAPMDFEVALKMRNVPELQARLDRGEQISLKEMQAKYDPLASDEEAVADWLTSQGMTITRRDSNRLAVFARGTVSQIAKAMQVSFARVSYEGTIYTSAVTAPSLPAGVAASVLGVNGLQPHIRPHKHLIVKSNSLSGTNPPFLPSQVAQADNATSLYNSNITGAGQSIAIVIDTFPATSDLVSFWKTYGVNQSLSNIQFIQVVAGTLPATSEEETLDTEWSSSMAPGARVRVYAAASLTFTALDQAYQQVYNDAINHPEYGLHQMTMSYGIGETYTSSAQVQTDAQKFMNLASAGVTCFASSGDGGASPGTKGGEDTSGPLQVDSPASDLNVTGVGGTTLSLNSSGNESSESAWQYSGGGVSIYFQRPSWQTGTGVPSGTMRVVPDVACPADPNTAAVLFYNGSQSAVGGTSWSSPTWAGYCALLNQARANAGLGSIGVLGPNIYPLIGTANFRDITSGNNITSNSSGNYSAGVGYDPVTGVGVPLMQALTQTLAGPSTLIGLQVQPVFQSIVPGNSASLTASASGSPTGYQWQRMPLGSSTWSNLTDTGAYSGSTTAVLTVNPVTSAMSGDLFQCIVQYASTSQTSAPPAVLTVETPLTITTLAGTARTIGTPTSSNFNSPKGIALDTSGNLYIADYSNNVIRKVTPAGTVTTPFGSMAGTAGSTNGAGNSARFNLPRGIASDGANNFYVADTGSNSIRKIVLSTGQVSTFATGFNTPSGMAVDGSGNVYVADTNNHVIKKITSSGTVSILAGKSGRAGYVDGSSTQARFNSPASVAVDASGNVYVADFNNAVIRKITPGGTVSTYAGRPGGAGYLDGPAALALFNAPTGVTVDSSGNVYVTDSLVPATTSTAAGNNLFRKITPGGAVSTLAGQAGVTGSAGGTGTAAQFYSLQAAILNGAGEFYLADTYNQLIRAGGFGPAITSPPLGQVITVGQPVTFAVTASGTGPLAYQWLKNNGSISGATGLSYTISSVAAGDAGNYAATVSNTFGSATSGAATLIPVNSQPAAQTVTAGQSATFSISVAGAGSFSYQWELNGAAISGATSSSYIIPSAASTDAGNYSVTVVDASGVATTSPVALTVNPALATDTPTLPPWALAVLGIVLFFTASLLLKKETA